MKIGIIGAGALGSVIGTLLLEAGLDVVLIERNDSEVHFVREQGLWIEGVSGERRVFPTIVSHREEGIELDLAFVLVKSYDTAEAAQTVRRLLKTDGCVLTLQNGIGNFELLEEVLPGRVLLGTTTMGAMSLGTGRYRHTGLGLTHFGEPQGTIRERTHRVSTVLERMNGGPVHVVDNAMGCVWSKLIINAGINAPATLLRVRNGDLPASEAGRELIHLVVQECLGIVKAKGIQLIFDDPEGRVIAVCEGTTGNINSMFQDILAGRRTEIDFISGALAEEGERLGLPVPVNRTLALLIKGLEAGAGKRVPDPDPKK